MREIRVRTWLELQERLFDECWDPALRRHRSRFAFRGAADATYGLATSVVRLGRKWNTLEQPIVRAFRRYALRMAPPGDDTIWSWLAIAQHHGLPTRLLDWTFSPYVALHFMTEDARTLDRDGIVWAVDYVRCAELLPKPLRDVLVREGANVFSTDMLAEVAGSLDAFDRLAKEPFAVFLEPPAIDERIVNQHALFSLMPNGADLRAWAEARPDLGKRIVVPAELKWEVRDKLDQANVNERVLYPGLDGLTRWLARYYTPREG